MAIAVKLGQGLVMPHILTPRLKPFRRQVQFTGQSGQKNSQMLFKQMAWENSVAAMINAREHFFDDKKCASEIGHLGINRYKYLGARIVQDNSAFLK